MGEVAELHEELIGHAARLAEGRSSPFAQADGRRAISATYYALFHLLTRESARSIVGEDSARRPLRHLLGRAYVHAEMARASKAFSEHAGGLPAMLRALGFDPVVPDDLAYVANALVELQVLRQRADYDPGWRPRHEEVLQTLDHGRTAMEAWMRAREEPAAQLYLIALLLWNRLPRE